MNPLKHGTLIALTAASLFASACSKSKDTNTMAGSDEKAAKVACAGVNACQGKGDCKTAANACAGQNACKGQGIVNMSADECHAAGGSVQSM